MTGRYSESQQNTEKVSDSSVTGQNLKRSFSQKYSFEDELRSKTPTQAQIDRRDRDSRDNRLKYKAEHAVSAFKTLCENTAQSGRYSCRCYAMDYLNLESMYNVFWFDCMLEEKPSFLFDSNRIDPSDVQHFTELISFNMKERGFASAEVYVSDILVERRKIYSDFRADDTLVSVAKGFIMQTSW